MLVSAASCGSDGPSGETTAPISGDTTAPITEDEGYSLGKYLEEKDMNGLTYTIFFSGSDSAATMYQETETGSLIDDAVYNKILAVEEFYNCDIRPSEMSTATMNATPDGALLRQSILAGEHEFDIVMMHDIELANQSLDGLYINLNDYDIFDYSQPWWPKNTVESLTVNGQMYLISANLNYYGIGDTRAMFFNKELAEDYQLGNLYDIVRKGSWTFDVLNGMVKDTYRDVNNNEKKDADDFYGIVTPYYYAWLEGFGIEYFVEGKDGTLTYDFQLDKSMSIVEAIYDLFFLSNGGLPYVDGNSDDEDKIFMEEKAIFNYSEFRKAVKNFSFSEITYGILPLPKLDSDQDQYYGGCTDRPCAIPVTVPEDKREDVMRITEAMNIEGYHTVFPAYYETALKTRYADDTDAAQMIDIIHDNAVFAFSYLYGGG